MGCNRQDRQTVTERTVFLICHTAAVAIIVAMAVGIWMHTAP